ncbi:alpha/beta hydrolase [Dongia soli]|uniref:Dienelactone hydrolase family protein n=1 Tax=Dongia soli TaxID=600628 RepID=A0ABU5E4P5_9PROT|nr:dienelactone hydrolase family protein [Dongia soli]MDY0881220.1 dienelactone hydrolase family protein [Dongia soli]
MLELQGPEQPPRSGAAPKKLVVFLHGYGSNGDDLISLAPYWAPLLPDAAFLSPNAPFPCEMSPYGFQWFSLDNRDMQMKLGGVKAAAGILDAFLDAQLARFGLQDKDLALVGFSQGTMMSLHVGPRRAKAVAGIVGYSGALIGPQELPEAVRARPPVLLVHGTADPVVPFDAMAQAEAALKSVDITVTTEIRPGLPHSIDEIGLQKGAAFLQARLADR